MNQQPNYLIKALTIFSSLLLVGGCVSYRSGVFTEAKDSAAKSAVALIGAEHANNPTSPVRSTDISPVTSKDMVTPAATKQSEPIVFSGTKAPIGLSSPAGGAHP